MIDTLGMIPIIVVVAGEELWNHSLLMKLLSFNQLSSQLMMCFPESIRANILSAYYCRRTRHRSILQYSVILFAMR